MSFSAERSTTVKLEGWSPSMLFNNLSVGPHKIAYVHKDSVFTLDVRATDGRAPPAIEKVVLPDIVLPPSSVAWCAIRDEQVLCVCGRGGFAIMSGDAKTLISSFKLSDLAAPLDDAALQFLQAAAVAPTDGHVFVGTSWGDIAVLKGSTSGFEYVRSLKGGSAPIETLSANDNHVVSGDASGCIRQFDIATWSLLKSYEGSGHPCTSVALRQDMIVAGFACGRLRLYRAGPTAEARRIEVEIAAHARAVSAVDIHPNQYTFASVGEDSTVNVWSLPEMASTGGMKVTLDMTAKVPDSILVGTQFVRHMTRPGACHLVCSAYDSSNLRVFLAL